MSKEEERPSKCQKKFDFSKFINYSAEEIFSSILCSTFPFAGLYWECCHYYQHWQQICRSYNTKGMGVYDWELYEAAERFMKSVSDTYAWSTTVKTRYFVNSQIHVFAPLFAIGFAKGVTVELEGWAKVWWSEKQGRFIVEDAKGTVMPDVLPCPTETNLERLKYITRSPYDDDSGSYLFPVLVISVSAKSPDMNRTCN